MVAELEDGGGYRASHLGAEKAREYDRDLWDPRTAKGLTWAVEQRLLDRLVASHLPTRPRSALDFACGTGRLLAYLDDIVPLLVGVDISPDMLAVAAERAPRARLVCGDVTADPGLVTEQFDLLTAFRFLVNAEDELRSDALRWLRTRLAPGGRFIANFHLNPQSARGAYTNLRLRGPN